MMSLHAQRGLLLARSAAEREHVALVLDRADAASAWIRTVAQLGAEAARYPLVLTAAAAVLIALRPRRALSWLMKGWSLYLVYKRGADLWARIAPAAAEPRR